MKTTYRNNSVAVLQKMAARLLAGGFEVSDIVIPENSWTDGPPYFHTSATNSDLLRAWRG